MSSHSTEKYEVNLEDPWDQGDSCYCVKKFKAYRYQGSDFNGVQIQVHGDSRDCKNDGFKLEAMAAKPTNKFKLTVPLWPAPFYKDHKKLEEQLEHQSIKDGNLGANTKYKKVHASQRCRHMILVFPEEMMLTDKAFIAKEKPTDELEIKEFHTACFARTGQNEVDEDAKEKEDERGKAIPIINMVNTVCWRLINTASQDDIEGSEKVKKGASGIAAALAKGKTDVLEDSDED